MSLTSNYTMERAQFLELEGLSDSAKNVKHKYNIWNPHPFTLQYSFFKEEVQRTPVAIVARDMWGKAVIAASAVTHPTGLFVGSKQRVLCRVQSSF